MTGSIGRFCSVERGGAILFVAIPQGAFPGRRGGALREQAVTIRRISSAEHGTIGVACPLSW
ncbi:MULTISPECIES: hypothetical protein [Streptomyces]|uniref:Uncharacterized protein n=1 Tax=Streptomyces bottropensis TaxID=42235 RepID=A0ABU8AKC0_9ACTN|nr:MULTISPECIES: hypothetical protein [Streptomyces]MZD23102.1 hypothetical protein [Streptomyces sp. SID5476]